MAAAGGQRLGLVAFKIIEWFAAIQAAVQRFTRGGAKLADHFGICRPTERTGNRAGLLEQCPLVDGAAFGWGYSVIPEFFPSGFTHPLGSPGWAEDRSDLHPLVTCFLQYRPNIYFNGIHCGATRIGWGDGDDCSAIGLLRNIAHNAQIENRQDGNFRIRYFFQKGINSLGCGSHVTWFLTVRGGKGYYQAKQRAIGTGSVRAGFLG